MVGGHLQTGVMMAREPFGKTLKRLREELGITQVRLAELMDTQQSTVANWEIRALPIKDHDTLQKLARHLRVSVDDLLGLAESPIAEGPPVWYTDNAAHRRLIGIIDDMPPGMRQGWFELTGKLAQMDPEQGEAYISLISQMIEIKMGASRLPVGDEDNHDNGNNNVHRVEKQLG